MLHRYVPSLIAVGSLVVVLGLPGSASAQSGRLDFAGGHALLYDHDLEDTFPLGWFAAVGVDVTDRFGLVGEVSGAYKSVTEIISRVSVKESLRVHAFLGGPRIAGRSGHAMGYAQLLIGGATASAHARANASGLSISVGESITALAVQPGGGVDIMLSNSIGLRFGANLRWIRSDGVTSTEFQTVAGVVFRTWS